MKQWFLRITEYKESLLEDLALLENTDAWPNRVVQMQRNWLGMSSGACFVFLVSDGSGSSVEAPVFTTRPDTLFGVQYVA